MTASDIEPSPSRRAAVALLTAAGLPSSHLADSYPQHFLFCGPRDAPTGLVGIELYGPDALLRSLAVAPDARRKGIGSALLQLAELYAYTRRASSVYLLTTTARHFFEMRGYRLTSRESCPAAIRSTSEFASLCSTSSVLLLKSWI